MNKMYSILICSLLLGACGTYSDVTYRAALYSCDDVTTCDADSKSGFTHAYTLHIMEKYDTEKNHDILWQVKLLRETDSRPVKLFISTTAKFGSTVLADVIQNTLAERQYVSVRRTEAEYELVGIRSETPLFVKVCVEAEPCFTHRIETHDTGTTSEYRDAEVTILPLSVTRLKGTIGGIQFSRYNDSKECLIENVSDTAVHFLVEVPERNSVVIEQLYQRPHTTSLVPCADLQEGDTVVASSWVGYAESLLDRIRDLPADDSAEFVWAEVEELEIVRNTTRAKSTVDLPAIQGVTCVIEKVATLSTGGDSEMRTNGRCENTSNDDVDVRMYLLKAHPATDTTYEIDYELADFSLNNFNGEEADFEEFVISHDGEGVFMIEVSTDHWFDPDLASRLVFELTKDGDDWTATEISADSFVETRN